MSQVTLPSPPTSPLNFWVTLASVSFAPGPSSVIVFSSQPAISNVPLAERFISVPPCRRRTRPSCAALSLPIDLSTIGVANAGLLIARASPTNRPYHDLGARRSHPVLLWVAVVASDHSRLATLQAALSSSSSTSDVGRGMRGVTQAITPRTDTGKRVLRSNGVGKWLSGRRDSDPRPTAWKAVALNQAELLPRHA